MTPMAIRSSQEDMGPAELDREALVGEFIFKDLQEGHYALIEASPDQGKAKMVDGHFGWYAPPGRKKGDVNLVVFGERDGFFPRALKNDAQFVAVGFRQVEDEFHLVVGLADLDDFRSPAFGDKEPPHS